MSTHRAQHSGPEQLAVPAVRACADDNVATLIEPVAAGDHVHVRGQDGGRGMRVLADQCIPVFHKMALEYLAPGQTVVKYGMVIGQVIEGVKLGGMVGVHNLSDVETAECDGDAEFLMPVEPREPPVGVAEDRVLMPPALAGYSRDGSLIGFRQMVVVAGAENVVNPVVHALARRVPQVTTVSASHGSRLQPAERDRVRTMTARLIGHPNVAASVVVTLDEAPGRAVIDAMPADVARRAQVLSIAVEGGFTNTVEAGARRIQRLCAESESGARVSASVDRLMVGIVTGGSDATSPLSANPAVGLVVDGLVDAGATVVFCAPYELIGCLPAVRERVASRVVWEAIVETVRRRQMQSRGSSEVDSVDPTEVNRRGGISTLAEKSAGCLSRTGSRTFTGVIGYGEAPSAPGLWLMDTPVAAVESMTGLAAAGCQAVLFTSGVVNPVGSPVALTLKISGSPDACRAMAEHVDVDISGVTRGEMTLVQGARKVALALTRTLAGSVTAAERSGFHVSHIGCVDQI